MFRFWVQLTPLINEETAKGCSEIGSGPPWNNTDKLKIMTTMISSAMTMDRTFADKSIRWYARILHAIMAIAVPIDQLKLWKLKVSVKSLEV